MITSFEDLFGVDSDKEIKVSLAYGTDIEAANKVMDLIKEKYNVKESFVHQIGSAVAVHGGPGLLAIAATW